MRVEVSRTMSRWIAPWIVGFAVLFAVVGIAFAQRAEAEPAKITEAKEEAAALRDRVETLGEELDAAVEEYNYAVAQLEQTKAAAEKNRKLLTRAEDDLATAQERLTTRVVNIYKQGRLGFLDSLFESDSLTELLNRFEMLKLIGEEDSRLVAEISTFRDDVEDRKEQLEAQEADQERLAAESAEAKQRVKDKLADNKRLLAGKEKEIAKLVEEEKARQAELAAQAREAARLAANRERTGTPTKPSENIDSKNVPSSPNGSKVIEIAMQYIGVPYVWAGASPSGFDCSGFVMYVYSKVGISLPHSSRMQYGCGVAINRADLQPGDLVFFGNPIHHVGIYVGNGNMIHSPHTGASVRINSISRSNYYGACRVF